MYKGLSTLLASIQGQVLNQNYNPKVKFLHPTSIKSNFQTMKFDHWYLFFIKCALDDNKEDSTYYP